MTEALADLANSFARYLRAEGRADRTVKLHTQAPRFFARWLAEGQHEPDLDALTRDNLVGWFNHLRDRGQKPGTVRIRHAGMLRFIGWLIDEDELDSNPMVGIRKPGLPDTPVPVLSDAELTALLKACKGRGFKERRDEAIIRLLLDCGVRVSELCGLTIDREIEGRTIPGTVHLESGSALVTGKRGKQRAVYFRCAHRTSARSLPAGPTDAPPRRPRLVGTL
ncbi:tyrosine-type recombinase/integrase [Amycolatopsis acidicola]|uniref:Tyrosine-type recombinase/integrase n=1 Tax=Amycolatopsis acidicola TaxID=2596893 RepID=A0A5N0VLA5_9PSEU|nr:tyrosine-type recombinase/integrase [Amycolatopsis acidicola]KAA9165960.1 tyrosine-type recombinase/integrase [Amycolatopsis acidicola]